MRRLTGLGLVVLAACASTGCGAQLGRQEERALLGTGAGGAAGALVGALAGSPAIGAAAGGATGALAGVLWDDIQRAVR